jgi:hypothetical protein
LFDEGEFGFKVLDFIYLFSHVEGCEEVYLVIAFVLSHGLLVELFPVLFCLQQVQDCFKDLAKRAAHERHCVETEDLGKCDYGYIDGILHPKAVMVM